MRAFALREFGAQPAVQELPEPALTRPDQVEVRVAAASLNKVDALAAASYLKGAMEHRFPVIIGRDFAGVVEQAGSEVTGFAVGDHVFGVVAGMVLHSGTLAEHVVVPQSSVAAQPAGFDSATAAALGLAGLTALWAVEAVAPGPGDVVLVVGATGGVGNAAVSLAADAGAHVIATGLPSDEATLRELGASEVVDRSGDVPAAVRAAHPKGIAALIDVVSQSVGDAAPYTELVADGGRAASALGAADTENTRGITATNVMAFPDREHMDRVADAAGRGVLRPRVTRTFTLDDVQDGLNAFLGGSVRGKQVVTIG